MKVSYGEGVATRYARGLKISRFGNFHQVELLGVRHRAEGWIELDGHSCQTLALWDTHHLRDLDQSGFIDGLYR